MLHQKISKIYSNEILPIAITISNIRPNRQRRIFTRFHTAHDDNPLNYFRVFLNFGYILQYIPFRLVKTGSTQSNVYTVKSSIVHKGICSVVHILSAYKFALSIREVLNSYTDSNPSPVLYFEISRSILTFIYMTIFKWTFWSKSLLFCSIINELAINKEPTATATSRKTCWKPGVIRMTTMICILYSVTPGLSVLLGSEVINIAEWKLKSLIESYGGYARNTFFLQETLDPYDIMNFDFATYFVTILYIIMHFYYFLGGHFFDLSVLMGALTLQHLSKNFAKSVSNMNHYQINKILSEYDTLKNLSKKINMAIGSVAFCFVVEALPWYATHFDDILTLNDWYSRFRYIFYFFNFFSILMISSDIIYKVDTLRIWIIKGDNSSNFSSCKLVALMNELSTNPVGLKPGGIVTITYGYIGTMVSVVVTYAVIILQFNFSSTHTCPKCIPDETPF